MPKGYSPVQTCSDGEVSTRRTLNAKERLRVVSTISHAAAWDGLNLTVSLDEFETMYTMAGGSGTKPQTVHLDYFLEFSFSSGRCVMEEIKRSLLFNGRSQGIVSIEGLDCTIIR